MNKEGRFILALGFANFSLWSVGPISVGSVASHLIMVEIWRKRKQRKRKGLGSPSFTSYVVGTNLSFWGRLSNSKQSYLMISIT